MTDNQQFAVAVAFWIVCAYFLLLVLILFRLHLEQKEEIRQLRLAVQQYKG